MIGVIVEQVERGISIPKLVVFYVCGCVLGLWLNIALSRKSTP